MIGFFRIFYVVFAFLAALAAGFLKLAAYYPQSFWIKTFVTKPAAGQFCAQAVSDSRFGWPISFARFFGGSSCDLSVLVNLPGFIFDWLCFLIIINILTAVFYGWRGKRT